MELLGNYNNRWVYWLDYDNFFDELPTENWICLATANKQPVLEKFEIFIRTSISKNILEFKGHGKFGEHLHDKFDETISLMNVMEGCEIEVMTTWHNNQMLADVFWQCFFGTCLPENANLENLKIVCTDLDGIDKTDELKNYIKKFKMGWLPPKH